MKETKLIIAHSRRRYTVYTQTEEVVNEILFSGSYAKAESVVAEFLKTNNLPVERLNYPVVGRRRTTEEAVKDFTKTGLLKIRKDLLSSALESANICPDECAIIYHGPFAYVEKMAAC